MEQSETVFHAGTALKEEQVVTAGGRVLGVTAMAATIQEALREAYNTVDKIIISERRKAIDYLKRELEN